MSVFGLAKDTRLMPAEVHCAAEIARFCEVALEQATKAREEGLRNILGATDTTAMGEYIGPAAKSGVKFIELLRTAGLVGRGGDGDISKASWISNRSPRSASSAQYPLVQTGGFIYNATSGFGVLGGIGQWVVLRYSETIMQDLVDTFSRHFRCRPLSDEDKTAMTHIGGSYSKVMSRKMLRGK